MGGVLSRSGLVALLSLVWLLAPTGSGHADYISTTDNEIVTFSVSRPDLFFEGRFPISVVWDDYFKASENDALTISYSLAAQPATLEVIVPLSDYLGWMGIDDVAIPVPLGDTLLGTSSMSLTSLAGIPSWLASLDLRLTGIVRTSELYCSSGSAFVQTDTSALTWSTWTTKSAQVVASESPGGSARATFSYLLGIGLTLSVIGIDVIDIIPSTTVISLIGYPSLETAIDVPAPAGVTSAVTIGVSIVVVVVVVAVALLMLRKRRGGPAVATVPKEEPTPQTP